MHCNKHTSENFQMSKQGSNVSYVSQQMELLYIVSLLAALYNMWNYCMYIITVSHLAAHPNRWNYYYYY